MKPNFFIIGAPKTGTTSIASYIGEHPDVCFSNPKEPFYWCDDIPSAAHELNITSLQEYLKLFKTDDKAFKVLAEGSTKYLRSITAVENILQYNKDAKFLVVLRNPSEVAYAYHMEQVFCHNEPIKDFVKAWSLQANRSKGLDLPNKCRSPECLQYGQIASYYEQVKRLMKSCPKDQYKIILFDDFKDNVAEVYTDILTFAGLPSDNRKHFPVENSSHARRFALISNFIMNPPKFLEQPLLKLRQKYWGKKRGLIPYIKSKFNKEKERTDLHPNEYNKLVDYFAKDVSELGNLLGKDLSKWSVYRD